jgi:hypothetical protein
LILRPFMALKKLERTMQASDPLAILAERLVGHGSEQQLVDRAVSLFRGGKSLNAL